MSAGVDALQYRRMDSGAKNRVRLWLRSEKAMGLSSVALPVMREQSQGGEESPAGLAGVDL